MRRIRATCVLFMAAVLFTGLLAESLPGQTAGVQQLSLTFREVVKKVKPAVVYIEVLKEKAETILLTE